MSVAAGESVAVVGPSGGGKSTSVSLIQRFYDVTQGQVCRSVDAFCINLINSVMNLSLDASRC